MIAPTNRDPGVVVCRRCSRQVIIYADPCDIERWLAGTLVQEAFPYLDKHEREMLLTMTCRQCWDKTIGDEEDDQTI
jgi:hypothetical protein